ncbi:MAG TPA: hypothetical protein VMH22_14570 [bacterium]|nr:hypothetical protein [bacterium]
MPLTSSPLDSLYQSGDYERVVQLAPAFLADSARSAADSGSVNRTYAFALVALGSTDEASAVFRSLIARDPSLTLDPQTVSPKIRAVFESVKASPSSIAPSPSLLAPRPIYRREPMPLTVLVPGLYQARTGRPTAGYALAGATALSLAGLVLSHVEYNGARTSYLSSSAPNDIADSYRKADGWSHARLVFSGSALAFWLIGLVSALRSP